MTPSNSANDSGDMLADALAQMGVGGKGEMPGANNQQQSTQTTTSTTSTTPGSGDGSQQAGGSQQAAGTKTPEQISDEAFNTRLNEMFGADGATLKTTLEEAKSAKELLGASPYKHAITKAMDELLAKNIEPEVALRYLTTDETKLGDKELMALDMRLSRTDMTPDDINKYIEMKYKIGAYKESDEKEQDGLLQLKFDSGNIRQNFGATKQKMLENGVSRDQVAFNQNQASRVENWKPAITKLKTELDTIQIPIGVDKDGKPIHSFPFKLGNTDGLFQELDYLITNSPKLMADEKGINFVKGVLQDRAIKLNLPAIAHSIATHAKGQNDAWWSNFMENPKFSQQGSSSTGGATSVGAAQGIANAIIEAASGR